MKNLLKNDHQIFLNSVNYQDMGYALNDQFELEAVFELAHYKMSIANDLSRIKFDLMAVVVGKNMRTKAIIFTFNSAISVISNLKKGVTEEKIKNNIFNKGKLNIKEVDNFFRPHIAKEINKFLDFTNFRENNILQEKNKISIDPI